MNPENRKQIIILAVFVVALIGALVYMFNSMPQGTGPGASASAAKPGGAGKTPAGAEPFSRPAFEGDLNDLLAGIAEVTFDYRLAAGDRPSPMRPKVASGPIVNPDQRGGGIRIYDVQRMRIGGIIWDEASPYAVIEGEVVTNGHDYGNGLKVRAIEQDRVIFDLDGYEIPVEMEEL